MTTKKMPKPRRVWVLAQSGEWVEGAFFQKGSALAIKTDDERVIPCMLVPIEPKKRAGRGRR